MKNFMGEQLELWLTPSGSSASTLGCSTALSVSIDSSEIDTSCKQTGRWGSYLSGKVDWSISTDGLVVVGDYNKLVDALVKGTPMLATFSTISNYDTANESCDDDGHIFNATTKAEMAKDMWYGYVVLTSISLTADNGSLATYSCTFKGRGPLQKSENNNA